MRTTTTTTADKIMVRRRNDNDRRSITSFFLPFFQALLLLSCVLLNREQGGSSSNVVEAAARVLIDQRKLLFGSKRNNKKLNVLIQYKNEEGKQKVADVAGDGTIDESTGNEDADDDEGENLFTLQAVGGNKPKWFKRVVRQGIGLKKVKTLQAEVTLLELDELSKDPNIEMIEENAEVEMLSNVYGEMESYGLNAINGGKAQLDGSAVNGASKTTSKLNPCHDDSDAVRVGVIDSGVDTRHPDLNIKSKVNVIGKSFGAGTPNWYEADDDHGKLLRKVDAWREWVGLFRFHNFCLPCVLSDCSLRYNPVCSLPPSPSHLARLFQSEQVRAWQALSGRREGTGSAQPASSTADRSAGSSHASSRAPRTQPTWTQ